MATDLSHMIPGGPVSGLVPTSQENAAPPHDNSRAMTAPGGEPSGEVLEHGAPEVEARAHSPRTIVSGSGGTRPVLRMGEWNTILCMSGREYYEANRERIREQQRQYYADNGERIREQQRQYYADNREARNEANRQYRQDNRERLLEYDRQRGAVRNGEITYSQQSPEYYQQWYAANAEAKKAAVRARRDALRAAVFAHYGESCACCGSTHRLGIDHIGGNGKQHRIEVFGRLVGGAQFYRWLAEQGFPEGYQTLCHSCNASKGDGEQCRLDHDDPAAEAKRRQLAEYQREWRKRAS